MRPCMCMCMTHTPCIAAMSKEEPLESMVSEGEPQICSRAHPDEVQHLRLVHVLVELGFLLVQLDFRRRMCL